MDAPVDGDHVFASSHPVFPDLALTFNMTSIQWYRKTVRNKARRDLRGLMASLPEQAVILAACWRRIESHLSGIPPPQDPRVYHSPPPSNSFPLSKQYQLFRSPTEFLKLLSPAASPSPPTQVEATSDDGDIELRIDSGEFEVVTLYTLRD